MNTLLEEVDLTTTKAPFIEEAKNQNQLFIEQPYALYSPKNQQTWEKLFNQIFPKWEKFANSRFLAGIEALNLNPSQIPRLEEINRFLEPLTGFQAKAVSGYVPSFLFFDCLQQRQFPTTITIRDPSQINYLPEPDIFHDIAGHVPMHTDPIFANILVKLGSLAQVALDRHSHELESKERIQKMKSNIRALSRFFWYTIEFGLMRENDQLRVYGSGLLSSFNEIQHSIESNQVQRVPFQLEWVINQSFEIDRFQPLLFVIDSFDHLYQEVDRLEEWLCQGKLDNVAFGEPTINDDDLEKFLNRENNG